MNHQPSTLTHIAIIPDGNRRWAKAHGIRSQQKIYEKGVEKAYEILEAAFDAGVQTGSFWAGSLANLLTRPKGFVGALENMYIKMFYKLSEHPFVHRNQIKIVVLGEWREVLRPDTIQAIQTAIDATAHYTNAILAVLVGYNGTREYGAALQSLLAEHPAAPATIEQANALLRAHSWTGFLPDVDLIVRTGAWQDPHLSAGFLGFLTAESQLAFPAVLWPDFSPVMLHDIIDDFTQRERRMGK